MPNDAQGPTAKLPGEGRAYARRGGGCQGEEELHRHPFAEAGPAALAFGVYQVAIALFMAIAPRAFFDSLGPYGHFNRHYLQDVAAFEDEMRQAKVDWQLVKYGGAVHSFTDWDAHSEGAAYNENADRRSWEAMRQFFAETLR